jgi:hypothetical protein
MKRLAAAAFLAWSLLSPASLRAADPTLEQSDSWTVAAEVNGRPLRLRVDRARSGIDHAQSGRGEASLALTIEQLGGRPFPRTGPEARA